MRMQTLVLGFLISVAAPAWVGAMDLIIRQRTTIGGPVSKTVEATQYWNGNKRVTDEQDRRSIVDVEAKTVTVADKQQKSYWVRTFDQLQQQSDMMKKRLESLPPGARQMLGPRMGAMTGGGAPLTVKPTGKTEKIAGYEAKEYTIESGGPMRGSVWATEAIQDPAAAQAAQGLAGLTGAVGPGGQLAEVISKIKGLPLRTTTTMAMGPQTFTTVTEVTEVKQSTPPAEVLTVPADFKKLEAPSFPQPPLRQQGVPPPQAAPAAKGAAAPKEKPAGQQ